jgi:glycosyltransferase involved in cell wall biosynthesis
MPKLTISYLVTVHNEARELEILLKQLYSIVAGTDDEIVILDDYSDDEATKKQLAFHQLFSTSSKPGRVIQHHLNGNFGEHKMFGTRQCQGDYIVQLDADEYLSDGLAGMIHELIEVNSNIDLFRLPRVNIVRGLNTNDQLRWGWRVNYQVEGFLGLPVINWDTGDRQGRIYRNSDNIVWSRKLHEVITGATYVADLPIDVCFSLIHDKTIERQTKQNEFYTKNWTNNENRGI